MRDDMTLLRAFAEQGDEQAFATIVSQYIDLVYSVARLQVRDVHLAEEVTQVVFIILARKAATLPPETPLSGWLCRTARNAAANALTVQRRRQQRELHYMESATTESQAESKSWSQVEPFLAAAMAGLGRKEHDALILRFFEGRSFRDVSLAMGTTEAASKMRVQRALEKMRKFFSRHGVVLSATALAGVLCGNAVQAAPVGLAASVTVAAAKGTGVTLSTLTLIKTTLKVMAYTKLKTLAVGTALTLTFISTCAILVHVVQARAEEAKAATGQPAPSFAGFSTPEAALKSFIWSESTGDLDKLLAACTPEQGERFKKKIGATPPDEIRQRMIEEARNRSNYEITDKEVISETEVRLHLRVQPYPGHPHVGNDVQLMQKIGNAWKYAGKYGVDIKG